MQKYNLESIRLSGNYLFFWDKMEKANYFMDQILECGSRDLTDRLVQSLLDEAIVDGAQWQMAINLVEKYGLVSCARCSKSRRRQLQLQTGSDEV